MTTAEAPAPSDRVSVRNDVVFGTGGGRDLHCDVYSPPAGISNGIGVLLVHGGGWRQGDRTQLRGHGILLGRRGYTCVSTEYRLTGESLWPAQIEDVKACLRWMKANASDLGIDPTKIVVSGNSAGGHLSLMIAGTANKPEFEGSGGNPGLDTSVAASIAYYPPTGLARREWGGMPALFGPGASEETIATASPMSYATAAFPPTMIIHGNQDEVVPIEDGTQMYDALHAAGVAAELHVYANQPHGFDADPKLGRECSALMASFIDRVVGGR